VFRVFNDQEEFGERPPTELDEEGFQEMMKNAMEIMGISDAFSFFYLGVDQAEQDFSSFFEGAVEEAEEEKGFVVDDVRVEINIKRVEPDTEDLLEKFERGEELSKSEISTLIRSGKLQLDQDTLLKVFEQTSNSSEENIEDGFDVHDIL
jgi:hypothetical protein